MLDFTLIFIFKSDFANRIAANDGKRKVAFIWFLYSRIPCIYGDMGIKNWKAMALFKIQERNEHENYVVAVMNGVRALLCSSNLRFSNIKLLKRALIEELNIEKFRLSTSFFGRGKHQIGQKKSVRKVSKILRNLTTNCTSNKLRKNIWVFLSLKLFLTLPLLYRKLFQKKFSFGIRKNVHLMTVRFISVCFIAIFLQEFDCKSICICSYCPC